MRCYPDQQCRRSQWAVPVGCISASWMVYAANNTNRVSQNMKPRYLIDPGEIDLDVDALIGSAQQASVFLKALAHEARLLILCLLIEEEKSVTEIEEILSLRQPAISQQLARLRADGLVETPPGRQEHFLFIGAGRGPRGDQRAASGLLSPTSVTVAREPQPSDRSRRSQVERGRSPCPRACKTVSLTPQYP